MRSPPKELLAPKALVPAQGARMAIPVLPRRDAFSTEQEHAYFRIFCEKTCINLAGDFGKSLWNRVVLQACEEEPALRHGVIALGALDKTCDATTGSRSTHGPARFAGDLHHTFALQQYGKSVKRMRELIGSGSLDMRKTLIGCLLAVCFESFHGNTQAAMSQARSGIQLINNWMPNITARQSELTESPSTPPIPIAIEDELVLAFNRLDINTVSFIYGPPVPLAPEIVISSIAALQTIPTCFASFDQARQCIEQLLRTTIHWVTYNVVRNDFSDEPVWNTTNDAPWVTTLVWTDYQRVVRNWNMFLDMYKNWWNAAQPLFIHARTPQGHRELSTAIAIELRFRTTYMAFSNIKGERGGHDQSLIDPREMLNLAESLNARRRAQRTSDGASFMFDGPFIGALHIVVQKSRDPLMRRRAIALLESKPRREGLWDSSMVAKLATLTLSIEEEGGEDGEIPDHKRIQASRTTFDLQRKRGTLQYRRRRAGDAGGYDYGSMEFTW